MYSGIGLWFVIAIILMTSLIAILLSCFVFLSRPEPHILLFRRPLGTDPQSGRIDPELERKARDEYNAQYGNRK
jgi:hypothetical protein